LEKIFHLIISKYFWINNILDITINADKVIKDPRISPIKNLTTIDTLIEISLNSVRTKLVNILLKSADKIITNRINL
jgi:hypothetical protein